MANRFVISSTVSQHLLTNLVSLQSYMSNMKSQIPRVSIKYTVGQQVLPKFQQFSNSYELHLRETSNGM